MRACSAVIATLVASLSVTVACGASGDGAGDAGAATRAPAAISTPAPAATASGPTPTPAPAPATGAAQPAATAAPAASPGDRTPKPQAAAGVERRPGSGEPETRTGKPTKTRVASARATKDSTGSGASGSSPGREYRWHDGDRVETVTLESGLVAQPSSRNTADDIVTRDDGRTSIVRRQARHATSDTQPVFRSPGGQLMTLPGGVLLVLDDSWDEARVDRFFADSGISRSDAGSRDWAVNAFFIRTKPGFPSLTLANELVGREGVEIASPNWQTEVALR